MKRRDRDHISDDTFFFFTILLAFSVLWFKFKSPFLRFYHEYRILIAFAISASLLVFYLKGKAAFLRLTEPMDLEEEVLSPSEEDDSVFAGLSERGRRVYIKQSYRRMHTQVIGTTNSGKTQSVILPWAVDDIRKGRGLLIVDGKPERELLDKLYAYACRFHRADDVRILSICMPEISHTFNPLAGGTPLEVTERVFRAFSFENEYYKSIQYEVLLQLLLLFEKTDVLPTPLRVIEALQSPVALKNLSSKIEGGDSCRWVRDFLSLTREEREQRTSGLITQFQAFAIGEVAPLFNSEKSDIDLIQVLDQGLIVYCQLPVLKIPTFGKAAGKLVLQCLQSAVASRHLGLSSSKEFFSVYLDDFTEYLSESFVSLLSKARSANVGVVFAHQAVGDLAVLGDGIQNTILTNANLKVFMRTNEPDSAEYFSNVIGTSGALKVTERQKKSVMGAQRTGDGSVRDVEEFKFHPNLFKQKIGLGEAVVVIPHAEGSLPVRLKFRKSPDLDPVPIPRVVKPAPKGLVLLDPWETEKRGGLDHLIYPKNETPTKEAA